jgi:hypothetical protein
MMTSTPAVRRSSLTQRAGDRLGPNDHAIIAARREHELETRIERAAPVGRSIDHDRSDGRAGLTRFDDASQRVDKKQITQPLP